MKCGPFRCIFLLKEMLTLVCSITKIYWNRLRLDQCINFGGYIFVYFSRLRFKFFIIWPLCENISLIGTPGWLGEQQSNHHAVRNLVALARCCIEARAVTAVAEKHGIQTIARSVFLVHTRSLNLTIQYSAAQRVNAETRPRCLLHYTKYAYHLYQVLDV